MSGDGVGWALAAPGWLVLLPGVAAVAWWRARIAPAVLLAPAGAAAPWPRSWPARLLRLPGVLELLALALGVLALAQPVQRRPAPPSPPGRDLLLCLDVSSSMAATDLAPDRTRLEVGIGAAREFVRARPADRVGLVSFARYADLRCPPTRDHDAVAELLGRLQLVAHEGPEDATAIGGAVATAAEVLRRSPARARVVVLVTDGEENVASALAPHEVAPAHAAQLCADAGIRVHVIVVGRGNQKAGRLLPLDTTAVRQLAAATGGRAFVAGDAAALAGVYAAIDTLEAVGFAAPGVVEAQWFPAAVALGLCLLVLARALAVWLRRAR